MRPNMPPIPYGPNCIPSDGGLSVYESVISSRNYNAYTNTLEYFENGSALLNIRKSRGGAVYTGRPEGEARATRPVHRRGYRCFPYRPRWAHGRHRRRPRSGPPAESAVFSFFAWAWGGEGGLLSKRPTRVFWYNFTRAEIIDQGPRSK